MSPKPPTTLKNVSATLAWLLVILIACPESSNTLNTSQESDSKTLLTNHTDLNNYPRTISNNHSDLTKVTPLKDDDGLKDTGKNKAPTTESGEHLKPRSTTRKYEHESSRNHTVISPVTEDQDEVEEILKVIDTGEQFLDAAKGKDIVIIFGNTRSGKDVVAKFLSGQEDKQIAVKKSKGVKEGKGTENSTKSPYPVILRDSKNKQFIFNYPAYDGLRNATVEIASSFLNSRIFDVAGGVKLMLVINYSSVRPGSDVREFRDLLQHAVKLIEDVKHFNDSIGLVVTQVDETYTNILEKGPEIKQNIASFIKNVQDSFKSKVVSNSGNNSSLEMRMSLLIDVLLSKERDDFRKFQLFAKPDPNRYISKRTLFQKGEINIENLVQNNTYFAKQIKGIRALAVSKDSISNVSGIISVINSQVSNDVAAIGNQIVEHFQNKARRTNDIFKSNHFLKNAYNDMSAMYKDVKGSSELEYLSEKLGNIVCKFNLQKSGRHLERISTLLKLSDQMQAAGGEEFKLKERSLKSVQALDKTVHHLHSSSEWNIFIIDLLSKFSMYAIQSNKSIYNVADLKDWGIPKKPQGLKITSKNCKKFLGITDKFKVAGYDSIKNMEFDEVKLMSLNSVINSTLHQPVKQTHSGPYLIFTGDHISLKGIAEELLKVTNTYICIAASHTVFIDHDLDFACKNVSLSIMAPKWAIIGDRGIVLNGCDGETPLTPWPRFNKTEGIHGSDGYPGSPGQQAENFFGIGTHFTDGKHLTVHAVGGVGGSGTSGGQGKDVGHHDGAEGGNGGNGGDAGSGGASGLVIVVALKDASEVVLESHPGPGGSPGKAGKGGLGDPQGKDGTPGKVADFPIINETFHNHLLPFVIIFKNHLRESLAVNMKKEEITESLQLLDSSDKVLSLFTTMSLVDEMKSLEMQFHRMKSEIYFLPLYQSALKMVEDYAKRPAPGEQAADYKKVRSYLYTAILSRVCMMRNRVDRFLIIDIKEFVKQAVVDMKSWREVKDTEAILKINNDYKQGIDLKIANAKECINEDIIVEIDNILKQIEGEIDELIQEIIRIKEDANANIKDLDRQKRKLKSAIIAGYFFTAFQIAGALLSLLGPLGVAFGTVISTVATVADNLVMNDAAPKPPPPTQITDGVKKLLKDTENQFSALRENKISSLEYNIKSLKKSFNEFPRLADMKTQIEKIENDLAAEKKLPTLDIKGINKIINDFNTALEMKKKELSSRRKRSPKALRELKVVSKLQILTTVANQIPETYLKVTENQAQVDALSEAIEYEKAAMNLHQEYEESIHSVMLPMVDTVKTAILQMETSLETMSHVGLDVAKLKIQSQIRNLSAKLRQYTRGTEVEEDLASLMARLDEAVAILLTVYDRIQTYKDGKSLGDYIKDIATANVNPADVKDATLRNAIVGLDVIIKANDVLGEYNRVVNSVKQLVFPFAKLDLEEFQVPEDIQIDQMADARVNAAEKNTEIISKKLAEKSYTINSNVGHLIIHNDFSGNDNFYTWRNSDHNHAIARLLMGEKILLKADVREKRNKNSVKFHQIGLHFQCTDNNIQHQLATALQAFRIVMTHLGNSYYKCDSRVFVIASDSISVTYSFQQNNNGEPKSMSESYQQLKDGDDVLSPYAMWQIQLLDGDFKALGSFKDSVDLILVGNGTFVEQTADICGSDLENYYKEIDTLTDTYKGRYIHYGA